MPSKSALCSSCRAGGWIETPRCQFDNHGRVRVGWGFEGTARPWGMLAKPLGSPRRLCCLWLQGNARQHFRDLQGAMG
jgi:hypothetical protein